MKYEITGWHLKHGFHFSLFRVEAKSIEDAIGITKQILTQDIRIDQVREQTAFG